METQLYIQNKQMKKMEEELDNFKNKVSMNLDRLSPFPKQRRESRFTLPNHNTTKPELKKDNEEEYRLKQDSFAILDEKFENNLKQITLLQSKVTQIEEQKALVEKRCVNLKRENEFLEKDISILRKEKDFYDKMFKNSQNDIKRVKDTSSKKIKEIESKFKSTISELETKLKKSQVSNGQNEFIEDSTKAKNMFISEEVTNDEDLTRNAQKRKINLLERNLSRIMAEKRLLLESNKALKEALETKETVIKELKNYEFRDSVRSGRRHSNYTESRFNNFDFSMTEISEIKYKHNIDRMVQTELVGDQFNISHFEQLYLKQLEKCKQLEETNNQLMEKLQDIVSREIKLQEKIEELELQLKVRQKYMEDNLNSLN